MNKYKKLLQNSALFLIANIGSKLISFLFVRFYTEYLSTEQYGTVDILITTVFLVIPFVTLGITEATLRFAVDKDSDKQSILSNTLAVILAGNVMFLIFIPLLINIKEFSGYLPLFYLLLLTNSLYNSLSQFVRGIGQVKIFAVSGVLNTIFIVVFNILFLSVFKLGIIGYLLANTVSQIISIIFIFIAARLHTYIKFKIERKLLRTMLKYSLPLISNAVFWWLMSTAARYTILYFMNTGANGIYSVANKIPTLISVFSSIFFQAWQLSAMEESESRDKSAFFSGVFRYFSLTTLLCASGIMLFLKPIYSVLVAPEYFVAWQVTPFLLLATVFSGYAMFFGTNYSASKKTGGAFKTTLIGSIVNVVLNIILTPIYGINGSAFSTMISFLAVFVYRAWDTRTFVKMDYDFKRVIPTCIIVLAQAIVSVSDVAFSEWIQIAMFLIIISISFRDVRCLVIRTINIVKSKKKNA